MRLFDKILKRNEKEQEQIQEKERPANQWLPKNIKRKTVKERYPDGLPLYVLKEIDYSLFGARLKQQQLLPPSYDRTPIGVEIRPSENGDHKVKLIFKSKTSASYRIVSLYRFGVTMAKNNSSIHEYMPIMSREWENFCKNTMWLHEKGWPISYVNHIKLKDEELDL